ncbi:heme lyase CcmF/NrfE family subunit [Litoribrevibacter albus]|uniref:Cytochrome c-type biogenesis protein CcmF n=1 Tax=Litoribrevibacter albus TaxID=1473156 RepID=A0AA37SD53_9GAMM|nr:heme lyase CcmF/NrfE family subunit [Litoribrevibacter albus]GLQ32376.1 cytochrome c-type biogenesis protein CcmF [Litoribrevibacter albus]
MIPELGHFALILALVMSVALSILPLYGTATNNKTFQAAAKPLSWGVFTFLVISFTCLTLSFLQDDFTVKYVASHSNSMLPFGFKFSAVWSAHEGSMLLWVLILGGWTFAVSILNKGLPDDVLARVLAVLGMVLTGFALFTLMTSNPFERLLLNTPSDGADLNPLLQDFGLIVHPPMLYMGYVGFSVAFAFAISALMTGKLDAAWAKWSRPWTVVAWVFLTLGIALGSWWAYYELGWGGWWFWDPVENASFMPWLVGTALIHTLAVTEKRGAFKSWTVLLAIVAFSLSLLGTFLVRSGVLTSVHAFATDPSRGYFILGLLAVTFGGSLLLYAIKAPTVHSKINYSWLSREAFLLINNIILTIVASVILLGTLYPLVFDALNLGKISVGPPYFNTVFVPMMCLLVVFMGIGPISRWKATKAKYLVGKLTAILALSIVAGLAVPFIYKGDFDGAVWFSMTLALWVLGSVLVDLKGRTSNGTSLFDRMKKLPSSYYGMHFAHLGVVVTLVGICMVAVYDHQEDVRMSAGDKVDVEEYTFEFNGTTGHRGPNYVADVGDFRVYKDGEQITSIHPEKRRYNVSRQVMTEAGIDPALSRDLYISLGEPLEGGQAWAVRLHVKPFIRWIWLGAILMSIGGILAVMDKRYRLKKQTA